MIDFILEWLRLLLTWQNAFIFYLLANLKCAPLSWHMRALYHLWRFIPRHPRDKDSHDSSSSSQPTEGSPDPNIDGIFGKVSITTRAPLMETDFNMHKSNSTYFSDLDMSRLALMTRVYFAGFSNISKELSAAGYTGSMSLTLGSVYCTFKRPVRPYASYSVSSRVLCWDRKWLYILSYFSRSKDNGEEIIAGALSKYVCKKGRFTVQPERLLRAAGLLPQGDEGLEKDQKERQEDRHEESVTNKDATPSGDAITRGLKSAVNSKQGAADQEGDITSRLRIAIEAERVRGLQAARDFIGLDDVTSSEILRMSSR